MLENSPKLWANYYHDKRPDTHKYDYGHSLAISGMEMTGATILASKAALRCGLGVLSIYAPRELHSIYKVSIYEALIKDAADLNNVLVDEKVTTCLVGQGAAPDEKTKKTVLKCLESMRKKEGRCILDAGALSSFEDEPEELFDALYPHCILTPHEREFAKLFGEIDRREQAIEQAIGKAGCTIVLKGSETLIASPGEETILNDVSSAWLATGGTGDVLSGILLGLSGFLGEKISTHLLAASAVWFHGKSGIEAGVALCASDLPDYLPTLIEEVIKKEF